MYNVLQGNSVDNSGYYNNKGQGELSGVTFWKIAKKVGGNIQVEIGGRYLLVSPRDLHVFLRDLTIWFITSSVVCGLNMGGEGYNLRLLIKG